MLMSDKESNFSELFENSKVEQGGNTSAYATEAHRQPIADAHYIENISFRTIDPIPKFHKRTGINNASLRQFKKNYDKVKPCLDLHGYTREAAIKALIAHIGQCQSEDILYFLVIFGKGLSSPREPVLKKTICSCMIACQEVLAYEFAKPKDGGDGAAYVMLRKR